jgi:hypothetical protein
MLKILVFMNTPHKWNCLIPALGGEDAAESAQTRLVRLIECPFQKNAGLR